ncbi:hypothetical protein GCM10007242_13580 [Pigmentiphaga litoralis]|uniref:DUF3613 domain-containing protein n=1 Tax=Pigmentiphaga litoralis TaxID=516702 RepID=UPI0016730D3A|nr:DUF3613 domain-containing protein [Pigmentiphaga litoralis]GGX08930.1 hypothetical protein GCM10007242_13580 [Pigmentiphaga litoralis]
MTLTRSTLMNRLALALPVALTLAAPLMAHAQNGPVMGTMMQTDGQQDVDAATARQQSEAVAGRERALQEQSVQRQAAEQAARQRAQQLAQQQAQQPAPTPSAAPTVVRQLPNPAAPQATTSAPPQPAAPAQAAAAAARPAAAVATAAPAAPAPQPAITGKPNVGDVSRSALAMQAEGRYAGPALPTLGATTRASWDRYVQSFRQPIPEFYPTNSSPKN